MIDDVLRLFPLILSWTAFWLFYSIVPTTCVRNRDAIIGSLVAALLFEAGKKRLPYISRRSLSYQLILRRDSRGAYFVCLGVLDVVYRLAWGRNYCHSRGIPQT